MTHVGYADFDSVYKTPMIGSNMPDYKPDQRPQFPASYVPVTPAGQTGPYLVNTYFLRDDRRSELFSSAAVRQFQLCGNRT
jgi:hypothetical protein